MNSPQHTPVMQQYRFNLTELEDLESLHAEIERLKPAELLLAEDLDAPPWLASLAGSRRRPPWHFDPGTGKRLLCEQLRTLDLSGFDAEDAPAAVGACQRYYRSREAEGRRRRNAHRRRLPVHLPQDRRRAGHGSRLVQQSAAALRSVRSHR